MHENVNDHYVFYGAVSLKADTVYGALEEEGIGYAKGQCSLGMCDLWVAPDHLERTTNLIDSLSSESKGPVFVLNSFPKITLKASRERGR